VAGYAGGSEADPSYRRMKGYTETVQVTFNPAEISYAELLAVFWASHDPTSDVYSRQYRNAIFYLNDRQHQQALDSLQRIQKRTNRPVQTDIEAAGTFYPAEDYHQKYYLRRYDRLLAELVSVYPATPDLVASTVAARLNGYLGCHGNPDQLVREIDQLGLSPASRQFLLDYVTTACSQFEGFSCPAPR